MLRPLGGEFHHIAVGIPEIDRIHKGVIGNAAHFHPRSLALGKHVVEHVYFDFQGDMEVEIMLFLEFKRHIRRLKKRQIRPIVQLKERMQY